MENVKLKECHAWFRDGKNFMSLIYEYENGAGKYELHIPAMEVPIFANCLPQLERLDNGEVIAVFLDPKTREKLRLPLAQGNSTCTIIENGHPERVDLDNIFYAVVTTEEKRVDMTLNDIETALGYKINLVEEKWRKNLK